MVTELNESTFDAFIDDNKYVLIDCWAPWCGPCRMIAPAVEKIAEERPDVKVCKINIDDEQELETVYGLIMDSLYEEDTD